MIQTVAGEIKQACKQVFENKIHSLEKASEPVLIAHFGEFSLELINSISEGAEELLIASNEKKGLIKRVFSILIEGLQNIKAHAERDMNNNINGLVIVSKKPDAYLIQLGNLILRKREESVTQRLTQLNSLSEEALKGLYLDVLSNGILSNKGGAGLGFITMRMKSKTALDFDFFQLTDDLSLFVVEILIQKEQV
jgi:hypothetical protein